MSQHHSHKGIIIVIILCLVLLLGLIASSIKQHKANKRAPRIARDARLKKLKKQHQQIKNRKENQELNKDEQRQDNAKQKAIDQEASKDNLSKSGLKINHKVSKKHRNVRKYPLIRHHHLSKAQLFTHDINTDRYNDRKFTKSFVYIPKKHQINIVYNRHGQILMHKKHWRKIRLGINKQLNHQDNQLHHLNHQIHFYIK